MDNKEYKIETPTKENSVFFKKYNNKDITEIKKDDIIAKLKTVFDPEIPVNIYDLGLIYEIHIDAKNNIKIIMTLTTPNCPVADTMPKTVGDSLENIKGISTLKVELVWEPQWTKEMMSEDAKLALDIY